MILDKNNLDKIFWGVVDLTCDSERYYTPHRFDAAQRQTYHTKSIDREGFFRKCHSGSGIRMLMDTDSETLSLDYRASHASSRDYFGFDLYVDCVLCEHVQKSLENERDGTLSFSLGKGEKRVCLYFPWSVQIEVKNVSIDDGAYCQGIPSPKRMLCFGDSITQGYDATYPSFAYANRLADLLGVEAVNKGIGADRYFPALLDTPESFTPDYITVAYGTNDWASNSRETFERDSKAFLDRLCERYPEAKIFLLAPIWRGDWKNVTRVGRFEEICEILKSNAAHKPNCVVIDCADLTPRLPEFYSDRYLHPNDQGFLLYAEGLYCKMKEYLA